jgi:DNA-binding NtrC family response regulator
LLIVDYTMPEMNGIAVIQAAREIRPDLPVLLMTGNADPEAIQNEIPNLAMMLKPFDRDALTRRVGDILESARNGVAHTLS